MTDDNSNVTNITRAKRKPGAAPSKITGGRAQISAANRNPVDIADDVVAELRKRNIPPRLFKMGNVAVLEEDSSLLPFEADHWLDHVARAADFYVTQKDGDKKLVGPPHQAMRIVPTVMLRGVLPALDGVVHTPYLDKGGNVVAANGYNKDTHLVLRGGDLAIPPIPETPTTQELQNAVELITSEWLGDFPFASQASRANAIALLLTLTGRAFFDLAPMFIVDAPTPGSGKGLLTSTISLVVAGQRPNLLELPMDGEEQRKKITSAVLAGHDLIVWDEVPAINGRTLALILTAAIYSDRLLGSNRMVTVPNRFTQVALGNNVQVWGDMKRRVAPIRLEPVDEHPEFRTGFRYPQLEQWVAAHRGELLGAVLTIWRAWLAAGRPRADVAMGSFERWARVIGGVLNVAGVEGFLSDTEDWLDHSDPDDDGWGSHLHHLADLFGARFFTVAEVVDLVQKGRVELPPGKRDPDRSLAKIIGNAYRSNRGRWIAGHRLVASEKKNSPSGGKTWKVETRSQKSQESQYQPHLSDTSDTPDRASRPTLAKSGLQPPDTSDTPDRGHRYTDVDIDRWDADDESMEV